MCINAVLNEQECSQRLYFFDSTEKDTLKWLFSKGTSLLSHVFIILRKARNCVSVLKNVFLH